MRPTPEQKTALRVIAAGSHSYDPARAMLRAGAEAPVVHRRVLDVLVARSWARWDSSGYRLELTDLGREALTMHVRGRKRGKR